MEAVQEFLTQQQDDSQAWEIRLNEAETIGILFADSSSIVKITESLLFFEENAFFAVRADRYCGFHVDVEPDGIFELTGVAAGGGKARLVRPHDQDSIIKDLSLILRPACKPDRR